MSEINKLNNLTTLVYRHPDWRSALKKRQHKFVISFIENNYDIAQVANKFQFTVGDMLSIFGRIEKALISFESYKMESNRKLELENQRKRELELQKQKELELQKQKELELQKQKELELQKQRELEKQKKYDEMLKQLDDSSKEVIKKVLEESQKVNIHEVYPERLATYIETILETKSLEKAAERNEVSKNYLVQRIKGRRKPRKPCEKGALYYLEQHSVSA